MSEFWKGRRVTVTGGAGFLGRHVVSRLEDRGAEVFVPRKKDYDFTHPDAARSCLQDHPSDMVIHAAAYYGGLGITLSEPATIFHDNLLMGANLMEAARHARVQKFVSIGTACSYPGYLEGNLKEKDFWEGPLHQTVAHYGMTKKILQTQGVAYKHQYGFSSIHLVPTNLYGPHDAFDERRSHVVAALVRRFAEAVVNGNEEIVCWGTGRAVREFLYVDDAAEGILRAAEIYDEVELPLNLCTGRDTTILELAQTLSDLSGFQGVLLWDASKPDGAPRKVLDPTRMMQLLSWKPPTDLRTGLKLTLDWYRENNAIDNPTS